MNFWQPPPRLLHGYMGLYPGGGAVVSPLTTSHAAKRSIFVNLKTPGNLKNAPRAHPARIRFRAGDNLKAVTPFE